MVWKIKHGKKWDNIEERAVYWFLYLVNRKKATPSQLEEDIDWIKTKHPNHTVIIGNYPFDKKTSVHVKYVEGVE